MDIEHLRATLTRLGVSLLEETFLVKNERGRTLLIVTRTGIDKIEATLRIDFEFISVSESAYKTGCNVTVVIEGKCIHSLVERRHQALGSANPDTTNWAFIADTAARRAKHKVVLKLADLYQHDVHSEDEAEAFKRPKRNDIAPAITEAIAKIK